MTEPTSSTPGLVLTEITKTYPGVRALDGVSVTVERGKVHAILGENGAGKSTLVGIAAGSVVPDSGSIGLAGEEVARIQPRDAREKGLAIVYQIPALAPSLTVVDSVLLLLPESRRPQRRAAAGWLAAHFESLGLAIDPGALVGSLSLREAHLIEIAAALASEPSVLVLDEPTEALGGDETRWLFARIDELLARGAAVVYITHRIPEVVEIATDLTVLRDGRVVGRGRVADFSEEQIVELIVGRSLETTFPDKAAVTAADAVSATPAFSVVDASSKGFSGVSLDVAAGTIVGLAGVEGNGQRELLRALSGKGPMVGTIEVNGRRLAHRTAKAGSQLGIAYLPGDRIGEAMFGKMSVRENVVAPSIDLAMPSGFLDRAREYRLTREGIAGLALKSPTLETPVTSLSGGSQQKVLLARSRLGDPKVLLVEDPTQGVDAGARVEIYAFLRRLAESGVAIVVLSTDAVELEGLCDEVLVFSRGRVMARLRGDEVTERAITGAAVLSHHEQESAAPTISAVPATTRRRWWRGEGQAGILAALVIALAAVTTIVSPAFLNPLNVSQALAAAATLVIVGVAQLLVVMTGGIDLSVGSVVALSGVIVSFFADGDMAAFVVGVVLSIVAGLLVGVVNGLLVTRLNIPPVIATLVTSIAIVGVAQVLRPQPSTTATDSIMTAIGTTVGGVPLILVVALAIAVVAWLVIARTRLGRGLRAAGSDPVKANRMGVNVRAMRMFATVTAGGLSAVAGFALYTTTGIGDANTGQTLTLTSVTAIVIAGASIFGGSGSAIAVAVAGLLLETITSALTFLSLSLSWQYWVQGAFVLVAAVIPLVARRMRLRAIALRAATAAPGSDTPAGPRTRHARSSA
ncbi:ATP-binding cassette domain-containing protein [Galbitalea soli]|uniref:ATP-binding cassette domain-containing protein n=1 Tax=Galbitalea soli TaxID=1268042 RepID=A0A7C9TSL7_9MICO|nr:ATP-binding cassette domain-containing protein [Galbitalea soli]NEM92355.1 ATP-binding cassette domain-containing protein [Galbitalea soli]NYJ31688.1 ribose transport system ATP-binding protein [Galbitalea soli]